MPHEPDEARHPLLTRQLKRLGLQEAGALPDAATWASLLERVSRTYRDADQERYTNERSLELSSREMQELHADLSVERDRLRSLIAAVGYGLVVLDPRGRVMFANPEAEQLLGWATDEFADRDFFALLEGEAAGSTASALRTAFERDVLPYGQSARAAEATFTRRDGRRIPVSWAMNPFERNGEIAGAYLVFHDDSHHQRIQDELRLAVQAAAALSRAKSEFLDNMSHEIRTPMNGVLGMLELLLATPLSSEQREIVDVAQRSGDGLMQILNDLLDYSKIEAGKMELEARPFDPGALAEDVAEMLARQAEQKALHLLVRVAPGVPSTALGDAGRLRQVLVNLVGNAIKFTLRGQVTLTVSTLGDGADPQLVYEVADTGIGLSPEMRARLFQPFTQADGGMNRRFGGTGLGLAITRRLADLMHGGVDVTSLEGAGSTFRFWLPLADATAAPAPPVATTGARALVVDDVGPRAELLRERLARHGFEVASVECAREAYAVLEAATREARPFAIAFVADSLPDAPGLAIWRGAPTASERPARCVLVVPSFGRVSDALLAEAGFAEQLPRPIRRDRLVRALGSALRPGRDAKDAAPDDVASGARRFGGVRALVVEDNTVNQRVIRRHLESLGCEVTLASDGCEGVETCGAGTFDVVFMDCQMPEMDGFEATRAIREIETPGTRVPIVAVTANALAGDRERCLDAGMDDFVTKPLKVSALVAALERWTKHAPPDEAARAA